MSAVHPASDDEIIPLRWFAGTGRDIESTLNDNQDVLCNWAVLGMHSHGAGQRVYVFERSANAVACIDGDGRHFGEVSAPSSAADWAIFRSRHDLRV